MNRLLFSLSLFAFTIPLPANAQPTYKPVVPADYHAPKADLEKWAARIRKLCPEKGWTVSVEGNDVLIQRDKPVGFRQMQFSQPPLRKGETRQESPRFEQTYRLRLRFAPLISQDKFEELLAENEVVEGQNEALLKKHGVYYRFDQLHGGLGDFSTTEQRKRDYERESKALVFTRLPNFYSTDYTLNFYHSWRWSHILDSGNESIDAECNEVNERIEKFFGHYAPLDPKWSGDFGLGTEETK